jgi:hypothetical protein
MMLKVVEKFYTLIDSAQWPNYTTIPDQYNGELPTLPFLRVAVVSTPTGRIGYNGQAEQAGQLKIKIITVAGEGQLAPSQIADALDALLVDRNHNGVQLKLSTVQTLGPDPDDKTKLITEYSVPFSYFGE